MNPQEKGLGSNISFPVKDTWPLPYLLSCRVRFQRHCEPSDIFSPEPIPSGPSICLSLAEQQDFRQAVSLHLFLKTTVVCHAKSFLYREEHSLA